MLKPVSVRFDPVRRQNSVRAEIIDDSFPGRDSPRLEAPPPRSPPADAPLGHALSMPSGDREPGPPPTARHPGRAEAPRHLTHRSGLLDPAAPILEPMGGDDREEPRNTNRSVRGLLASRKGIVFEVVSLGDPPMDRARRDRFPALRRDRVQTRSMNWTSRPSRSA